MNATTAKSKMTVMERTLHKVVFVIFLSQLAISIFSAFGRNLLLKVYYLHFNLGKFLSFVGNTADTVTASEDGQSNLLDGFRYFLILNTLIPISLVVNLEVVRLLQCVLTRFNYELNSVERGIECKVNTSTVNEELGQIEYILTDKTGTLTQNKMVLQGLCVGEQIFGGEFVRGENTLDFESFVERSKKSRIRLLAGLEDKFDANLHNLILSKDKARLKRPLVITNKETQAVDFTAEYFTKTGGNVLLNNARKKLLGEMEGSKEPKVENENTKDLGKEKREAKHVEMSLDENEEKIDGSEQENRNLYFAEISESQMDGVGDPADKFHSPILPRESKFASTNSAVTVETGEQTFSLGATPYNQNNTTQEADLAPKAFDFTKKKPDLAGVPLMSISEDIGLNSSDKIQSTGKLNTINAQTMFSELGSQRSEFSKLGGLPPISVPGGLGKMEPVYNFQSTQGSQASQFGILTYQELLQEFLTAASLCHECIVEKDYSGQRNFQGPSPDEIAICKGARDIGCIFLGSNSDGKVEIEYFGQKRTVELIMDFPFDSDRKRHSVLVKDGSVYKLFVKGADNSMIDILSKRIEHPFLERTEKALDEFSTSGLRTLVFGYRIFTEKQFKQIMRIYRDAVKSHDNKHKMVAVCKILEDDLILLGCTAIRDHLQEKVHESISRFVEANIKVWMITGDKLQTAESIGYSAGILQSAMKVFVFDQSEHKTKEDFPKMVVDLKRRMQKVKAGTKKAIVVDISHNCSESKYQDENLKNAIIIFQDLLMEADAVVCARSSPKQKAKLVKLVKSKGKIVLAVGDGANDVNMLSEANVGVGIYGEEGMQAVQVSDYAIANFRYLWKLILVQGRWNNIRLGKFINFFLYKNFIFTLPQFIYGFINIFSGNPMFDGKWSGAYNLLFTSFPISYIALWDKDVTYEYVMNSSQEEEFYQEREFTTLGLEGSYTPTRTLRVLPLIKKNFQHLYYITQRGWSFGWDTFLSEVINSIGMSFVLCVMGYGVYSGTHVMHEYGYTADFWMASFAIYTCLVYLVNVMLLCRADQITWLLIVYVVVGSLIPFHVLTWTFDVMVIADNTGMWILANLSDTYHYYLLCIALMMIAFYIEFCKKTYRKYWKPTLADYFRQLIKNGQEGNPEMFKPEILEAFIRNHDPIVKKVTKKDNVTFGSDELREAVSFKLESGELVLQKQESHREKIDGKAEPHESDQNIKENLGIDKNIYNCKSKTPEDLPLITSKHHGIEGMDCSVIKRTETNFSSNQKLNLDDTHNSHLPSLSLDNKLANPCNLKPEHKKVERSVSPSGQRQNSKEFQTLGTPATSHMIHKMNEDKTSPGATLIERTKGENLTNQDETPHRKQTLFSFPLSSNHETK